MFEVDASMKRKTDLHRLVWMPSRYAIHTVWKAVLCFIIAWTSNIITFNS